MCIVTQILGVVFKVVTFLFQGAVEYLWHVYKCFVKRCSARFLNTNTDDNVGVRGCEQGRHLGHFLYLRVTFVSMT